MQSMAMKTARQESDKELVDHVDDVTDDEGSSSAEPDDLINAREKDDVCVRLLERPPRIAWRPNNSGYRGFFERQEQGHCGMHALNNAVGFKWQSISDMQHACDAYVKMRREEGENELHSDHARTSGWYSIEVMCHAMRLTSMRNVGKIEYELSLNPLHRDPEALRNASGAVVNLNGMHWVALRCAEGDVWLLDSQEPHPTRMTNAAYHSYVHRHRNAFAIFPT